MASDNSVNNKLSLDDINLFASVSGAVNVTNITIDSSLKIQDNEITALRSNDNIILNASGTGSVLMSKVDIDDGTVDGTTIGATTPAAGSFTTLKVYFIFFLLETLTKR